MSWFGVPQEPYLASQVIGIACSFRVTSRSTRMSGKVSRGGTAFCRAATMRAAGGRGPVTGVGPLGHRVASRPLWKLGDGHEEPVCRMSGVDLVAGRLWRWGRIVRQR